MEWEREWERDEEAEADRLVEELQELLCSPAEQTPDDVPAFDGDAFADSFNQHQLHTAGSTDTNDEKPADTSAYREKLRSHSSFPRRPAATVSDTSSQCTNADMMDTMYEQSFSDGNGSHVCRRLGHQGRQRRQSKRDQAADATHSGPLSRRSYECDVCGRRFHSPQSLGGHKNLHRSKGKSSGVRRRYRAAAAAVVDRAGSGSSSASESETAPYKGVRCREGDKWVTEIRPPRSSGQKWWLGTFPSAEEAAQAYDVALAFFKSESELNFGYHPLYQTFEPFPPDLSPHEYALQLRQMVKEFSEKIISERRRSEEPPAGLPHGPAPVSPAGSSSSTVADPPSQQEQDPPATATEFEWLDFLNFS